MNTLNFILKKYNLTFDETTRMPIQIPNVGRSILAEILHELKFKKGVEVGVAKGEYSEVLCKANPKMKFWGVDPWKGYRGYNDYTRTSSFKALYKSAVARLSPFKNYKFIKAFSMDALKKFKNNSLDFVYIDANHTEPFVSKDITGWYKKVKKGGILAGHDYVFSRHTRVDVVSAINSFTRLKKIRPWFVLGTWQRIPGTIREDSRTWVIVK